MARVVAGFSMSLDGFIARPDDSVGPLFDWYGNGATEVRWPGMGMVSKISPASAGYLHGLIDEVGALVVGRRIFDYTNGWGGNHPLNVPVFVVTHATHALPDGWPRDDVPFTFVHDGVASAVKQASAVAGSKTVGVAGPNIAQQCLALGLLDEINIDLVPVLLGTGIRFFAERPADVGVTMLDGPTIINGDRVTHLRYTVRRGDSVDSVESADSAGAAGPGI